jgi:hypothetical protein
MLKNWNGINSVYYEYFCYMNKQFSNLSSEIENIYGIKEENR